MATTEADPSLDGLRALDAHELAALLSRREVSSEEVTREILGEIDRWDRRLHSYAHVAAERALARARAADAALARGERGDLLGVPVAVKDLFWTREMPTAAGTTIHRGFVAPESATCVQRLEDAGAVLLGKLQMTEAAMLDHHPEIAPPVNPWDPLCWTGSSSSGSAVATAAGLCFASLGSDTGGSIRHPAAACGLTGVKPTWGRVSRHGVFPLAPSLDHVGPMARSAHDAAIMLQAIAGADVLDPTASTSTPPDFKHAVAEGVAGLRIGLDRRLNSEGVDAAVQDGLAAALTHLEAGGAVIEEIAFPDPTAACGDWLAQCAAEMAVAHADTYPVRKADYGPSVAAAIELGRALKTDDLRRMAEGRAAFRARAQAAMSTVDLMLTPTHPFSHLTLRDVASLRDRPDLVAGLMRFTATFNLTGQPTLCLPGGFSDGVPFGLQFVAAAFDEAKLFRAAGFLQQMTDHHRRRPDLHALADEPAS